jgi:hypothetical protein
MAREPSYPDDAPVGDSAGKGPAGTGSAGSQAGEGADDKAEGSKRTRHIVTGAAIGIGSAALVAALLYANRSRKGGDDGK